MGKLSVASGNCKLKPSLVDLHDIQPENNQVYFTAQELYEEKLP